MGQLGASGMNVNGTGQTVGDLSKIGYTPDQISQMGTSLNGSQKAMKAGLGGLKGFSQQQQGQQQPPNGGGAPINITPAPQVNLPQPFQPNSNGFQKGPMPNSLFFGGGF